MAELIRMPFGAWTRIFPRNHESDGGPDLPMGGALMRTVMPCHDSRYTQCYSQVGSKCDAASCYNYRNNLLKYPDKSTKTNKLLQQSGSQKVQCSFPLMNKVENVNYRQVLACSGMTPNCSYLRGVVSWAHSSPQSKRRIDRYIRFCAVHIHDQQKYRHIQTERQTTLHKQQ